MTDQQASFEDVTIFVKCIIPKRTTYPGTRWGRIRARYWQWRLRNHVPMPAKRRVPEGGVPE